MNKDSVSKHFPTELQVRYYVVGLFDLLGQQRALAEWRDIGKFQEDQVGIQKALAHSVDAVLRLRAMASRFLDSHEIDVSDTARMDSLPPTQRAKYKEYMDVPSRTQVFGDTVLVYAPAHIVDDYPTLQDVFTVLGNAASTMITGLASGLPIRGAIDVGPATEFGPGDLYGPALASVHHLESKIAGHPRIIVGPGIISLLDDAASNTGKEPKIWLGVKMAELCRSFMRVEDGQWTVDYLGRGVAELIGKVAPNPYDAAFRFVVRSLDAFSRSGEKELTRRYQKVHEYFLSRRQYWTE